MPESEVKKERLPSSWSFRLFLEPIMVELNRHDLHFIISGMEQRRDQVFKEFELLKTIRDSGEVTEEDRKHLPENLKELSFEELVEQIDSWYSLSRTYTFYAKKFKEYLEGDDENTPVPPEFLKWPDRSIGINGIVTSTMLDAKDEKQEKS